MGVDPLSNHPDGKTTSFQAKLIFVVMSPWRQSLKFFQQSLNLCAFAGQFGNAALFGGFWAKGARG